MGRISDGMISLCQNIVAAYGERKKILVALKKESADVRSNARKFINDCERLHAETARALGKTLKNDRETLAKIVKSLREDFRKEGKEIRADLREANKCWIAMDAVLKGKKAKK